MHPVFVISFVLCSSGIFEQKSARNKLFDRPSDRFLARWAVVGQLAMGGQAELIDSILHILG